MTILNWTPPQPPGKDNCPYDHCTAETPFGRFLITWKGWKQYNSPTVDDTPWGDWFGAFGDIEAAQQACEDEYCKRLQAALAELEPERLTVAQINELPNNSENFIWEDPLGRGWMILDGTFSRDDLQQLADSIPVSKQKDLDR